MYGGTTQVSRKVIGYNNGNRRRDQRVARREIFFVIGRHEYEVVDLSLGGFRMIGYQGGCRAGDKLEISEIHLPEGGRARIIIWAEVIRRDSETGDLSCRFIDLNGKAFDCLERLVLRGRLPDRYTS